MPPAHATAATGVPARRYGVRRRQVRDEVSPPDPAEDPDGWRRWRDQHPDEWLPVVLARSPDIPWPAAGQPWPGL